LCTKYAHTNFYYVRFFQVLRIEPHFPRSRLEVPGCRCYPRGEAQGQVEDLLHQETKSIGNFFLLNIQPLQHQTTNSKFNNRFSFTILEIEKKGCREPRCQVGETPTGHQIVRLPINNTFVLINYFVLVMKNFIRINAIQKK
jgi:hypothetical protein